MLNSTRDHVGLFSEEIGPTGEQLGKSQAFTHLSLINAAMNLDFQLDQGRHGRLAPWALDEQQGRTPPLGDPRRDRQGLGAGGLVCHPRGAGRRLSRRPGVPLAPSTWAHAGQAGERSERRARLHDFFPCPRQESNLRHSVWEPVRNLMRPRATCEMSRQPFDKGRNAKGGARTFSRQGGCGATSLGRDGARDRGKKQALRPLVQSARERLSSHRSFTVAEKRLQTLNGV